MGFMTRWATHLIVNSAHSIFSLVLFCSARFCSVCRDVPLAFLSFNCQHHQFLWWVFAHQNYNVIVVAMAAVVVVVHICLGLTKFHDVYAGSKSQAKLSVYSELEQVRRTMSLRAAKRKIHFNYVIIHANPKKESVFSQPLCLCVSTAQYTVKICISNSGCVGSGVWL